MKDVPAGKHAGALLTIGEVSAQTGVAPHILRYWESRFPQLRPLTRAGQRRYYRPDDVMLVRRIASALASEGYSIKGVQQLLAAKTPAADVTADLRRVRALFATALAG